MLLAYFGGPAKGLERKSSRTDMVSDADREAEETVISMLRAERPDDGMLAEEGSSSEGTSGRRWVVDPLDGTTNFLYGFPAWAVSVALEDAGGGAVGAVLDPLRGQTFTALRGAGAWLDGEPISVRDQDSLDRALIATGFSYEPERRASQAEKLCEVIPRVRDIRRAGAASLDLCWVAAGRLDGYFERGLQPWDWAAGRLVVAEAGGEVAELPERAGEPAGLVAAVPAIMPALRGLVA